MLGPPPSATLMSPLCPYPAPSRSRDPATTDAAQAAVRRLGFEDRVALEGAVGPDRLTAAYDTADAFVLASALEGYGMAFAEAMARGLPIVASGERSEEHTSELQSLLRISYAVFFLKKKNTKT